MDSAAGREAEEEREFGELYRRLLEDDLEAALALLIMLRRLAAIGTRSRLSNE